MITLFGCAQFFNFVSFLLYPTEVKRLKCAMLGAFTVFLALKFFFILSNRADPDEMQPYGLFYWVCTVCQSTCLPASRMKEVSTLCMQIETKNVEINN